MIVGCVHIRVIELPKKRKLPLPAAGGVPPIPPLFGLVVVGVHGLCSTWHTWKSFKVQSSKLAHYDCVKCNFFLDFHNFYDLILINIYNWPF